MLRFDEINIDETDVSACDSLNTLSQWQAVLKVSIESLKTAIVANKRNPKEGFNNVRATTKLYKLNAFNELINARGKHLKNELAKEYQKSFDSTFVTTAKQLLPPETFKRLIAQTNQNIQTSKP